VIVSAIMQMAHGVSIATVSEGVETAQQHQTVTNLGSDGCQGFYFAKRMLATNVDALIVGRPNPEARAHRLDAEVFAMPIDERAHFGRSGSQSAKTRRPLCESRTCCAARTFSRPSFRISSPSSRDVAAVLNHAGDH
jgi:EAL domain-containing protein (putative c-di-GMP-specific phosphodiesterase class I)